MWRMTPRFAIATLLATLAPAASATMAHAAATVQSYSYSTSGSISAMPNTGPVEFLGMSDAGGMLTTPGAFSLGTFQTNPLPATATLTFANTPFMIDVLVASQPAGGVGPAYDYHVSGLLNGSITGAGMSSMYAVVTSITGDDFGLGTVPPFPVADLSITSPQGIVAPNGLTGGLSLLTGQVMLSGFPMPAPAPEPTSIAAFAAGLAGLALRRRLRPKGRAAA